MVLDQGYNLASINSIFDMCMLLFILYNLVFLTQIFYMFVTISKYFSKKTIVHV